jgi:hypothetical protein
MMTDEPDRLSDPGADDNDVLPEFAGVAHIPQADIARLLFCVRQRFLNDHGNAIVLAIEGLKWLSGLESMTTREGLDAEAQHWEAHPWD